LQQSAWFPVAQIAPGVILFGLVAWERRRRYLEQHPEIILRRRAKRGLRRERRAMRRAAREGDPTRFGTAATKAMQVASAPHYAAEARALVGADVLELLQSAEENGEHHA